MPRILYVTGLWSGLADMLYHGSTPRGMPAFVRPLKALIERGYDVDLLILAGKQRELNIGVDWLKSEQVVLVNPRLSSTGMLGALAGFFGFLQKRLRKQQYDFIYGQGTVGTLGVLAARKAGITCGQRLYGVSYFVREFLSRRINSFTRIGIFFRHPLHYMAFSLSKSFLLVTNDGTRADIVYRQIGNKDAEFLFWLNGVDRPELDQAGPSLIKGRAQHILLYPGRIDRFKRQHLAIEMLHILQSMKAPRLKLVFVGHDYDLDYRAELDKLVMEYGLSEHVEFLGPVSRSRLQELYHSCLAVLSFYDVSNLGNVAIEALACGAPLLSLADGSLDTVAVHGESVLLVHDMDEAAAAVCELLDNPDTRERLKQGAKAVVREHFASWDERIDREIARIDAAITSGSNTRRGA